MISVLIWTGRGMPEARLRDVSRTLAALVPFAVEGLVRDVVILADATDAGLLHLADEAGAAVFGSHASSDAVNGMKSDVVLVLNAGFALDGQLADRLANHIYTAAVPAPLMIEAQGGNWLRAVFAPERVGFLAPRSIVAGLKPLDPGLVRRQLWRFKVLKARSLRQER